MLNEVAQVAVSNIEKINTPRIKEMFLNRKLGAWGNESVLCKVGGNVDDEKLSFITPEAREKGLYLTRIEAGLLSKGLKPKTPEFDIARRTMTELIIKNRPDVILYALQSYYKGQFDHYQGDDTASEFKTDLKSGKVEIPKELIEHKTAILAVFDNLEWVGHTEQSQHNQTPILPIVEAVIEEIQKDEAVEDMIQQPKVKKEGSKLLAKHFVQAMKEETKRVVLEKLANRFKIEPSVIKEPATIFQELIGDNIVANKKDIKRFINSDFYKSIRDNALTNPDANDNLIKLLDIYDSVNLSLNRSKGEGKIKDVAIKREFAFSLMKDMLLNQEGYAKTIEPNRQILSRMMLMTELYQRTGTGEKVIYDQRLAELSAGMIDLIGYTVMKNHSSASEFLSIFNDKNLSQGFLELVHNAEKPKLGANFFYDIKDYFSVMGFEIKQKDGGYKLEKITEKTAQSGASKTNEIVSTSAIATESATVRLENKIVQKKQILEEMGIPLRLIEVVFGSNIKEDNIEEIFDGLKMLKFSKEDKAGSKTGDELAYSQSDRIINRSTLRVLSKYGVDPNKGSKAVIDLCNFVLDQERELGTAYVRDIACVLMRNILDIDESQASLTLENRSRILRSVIDLNSAFFRKNPVRARYIKGSTLFKGDFHLEVLNETNEYFNRRDEMFKLMTGKSGKLTEEIVQVLNAPESKEFIERMADASPKDKNQRFFFELRTKIKDAGYSIKQIPDKGFQLVQSETVKSESSMEKDRREISNDDRDLKMLGEIAAQYSKEFKPIALDKIEEPNPKEGSAQELVSLNRAINRLYAGFTGDANKEVRKTIATNGLSSRLEIEVPIIEEEIVKQILGIKYNKDNLNSLTTALSTEVNYIVGYLLNSFQSHLAITQLEQYIQGCLNKLVKISPYLDIKAKELLEKRKELLQKPTSEFLKTTKPKANERETIEEPQ